MCCVKHFEILLAIIRHGKIQYQSENVYTSYKIFNAYVYLVKY